MFPEPLTLDPSDFFDSFFDGLDEEFDTEPPATASVEEDTNGMEEMLDWDVIESMFDSGEIQSMTQFTAAVREQLSDHLPQVTKAHIRQAIDGLMPVYQLLLILLPRANHKLNWSLVREMRERHANGEGPRVLGAAYGVSEATASRVLRHHTWKENAA